MSHKLLDTILFLQERVWGSVLKKFFTLETSWKIPGIVINIIDDISQCSSAMYIFIIVCFVVNMGYTIQRTRSELGKGKVWIKKENIISYTVPGKGSILSP